MVMEWLNYAVYISHGILMTLTLLTGGLFIGIAFGLLAAIARYRGILVFVINFLISVIRGTPLILQLAFVYFVLPGILGVKLSVLMAGIIAFGLNSSAYVAEILRAGIDSIPKGQFEAAQSLKISNFYLWKDIILPQVIKNILPAMINEIITLLKETALIATIGGMDIMRSSQILAAEKFTYFAPLIVAGIYYYIMVLFVEFFGKKIAQLVSYVDS